MSRRRSFWRALWPCCFAGMERAHPKLFQNLARLKPSIVYVEPTDLPHRFELKYGGDEKPTVRVLDKGGQGAAGRLYQRQS